MEIQHLANQFSDSRFHQIKAIYASIFILQNRLQTAFDKSDSEITSKQFMLLVMIRRAEERQELLTFTQAGKLLGCSRQNIKKLALLLEEKGLVFLARQKKDSRASAIRPTQELKAYFSAVEQTHEQLLNTLFEGYSDEEIHHFFQLLTKLYQGVSVLEETVEKGLTR